MLAHDALPLDERGAAYLHEASHRVVIFDGAMGTSLQLLGLSAEDFGGPELEGCNEALVLSRPDAVASVHQSFLEVGVDVIETDAFGAFGVVLAEYGLQDRVRDINLAAAEVELAGVVGREVILRDLLLQDEGAFDFVLMDCAPSLGVLTLNAENGILFTYWASPKGDKMYDPAMKTMIESMTFPK